MDPDPRVIIEDEPLAAQYLAELLDETMPRWKQATGEARSFDDLPVKAQRYLHKICELTGAKLMLVGVGSSRAQTIIV